MQLKLLYLGVGKDDTSAYPNTQNMMALFDKYGITYEYRETSGGHTWFNWRIYLSDFAPKLFR